MEEAFGLSLVCSFMKSEGKTDLPIHQLAILQETSDPSGSQIRTLSQVESSSAHETLNKC